MANYQILLIKSSTYGKNDKNFGKVRELWQLLTQVLNFEYPGAIQLEYPMSLENELYFLFPAIFVCPFGMLCVHLRNLQKYVSTNKKITKQIYSPNYRFQI